MSETKDMKQALKAAETALEEAIVRQTMMEAQYHQNIGQIVHDIKNPLSAMLGCLNLITKEVAGPLENTTYAQCVKTLDKSANRLLGICNDLLGEHVGGEKTKEPEKVFNVSDLVDEIQDLFAAQAKERGIRLGAKIDKNCPQLEGDPQEVYRAVMNLVSNAIKFTPSGGNVQIQTEVDPKDNTFIMVVRDSGVGMTQDQINLITSTKLTTVSPHGDVGTGQGLSIVNGIVAGLGGKLSIVSTENSGTKIKIRFPKSLSMKGR